MTKEIKSIHAAIKNSKKRECSRKYRINNPEKIKEHNRVFREINNWNDYMKQWRFNNPDKSKESQRKSGKKLYWKNPQKYNKRKHNWRQNNPENVKRTHIKYYEKLSSMNGMKVNQFIWALHGWSLSV